MSNARLALALAFTERERLESQRGDLQRRLDASQNQSNEHAALSSEVGSLRQKLAHTESEYGGMRAQLDAVGKERAEREAELTGALESLAKAESQVAELRARHEASLQSAGEETRRTIDELRHKLNTLETQREQELDVHADEVSQMKKAVAKAEAAATELLDQHSAAEKASSEAARAQIESLKSDLAKVTAQFEEERAGRDRERAELKAALGKAEADASELQAKHAAGMQAGGEEFAKTIRGLQSQLDGVNAELAQREDALRVLSQRLLSSEERALEHEAKMSEMTIALERATEEAAEAMRQRDESMSLPSRLAGQEAGRLIVRKTRLERYKRLLAVQSDKLYRAKAALKTRTDECEKVLAKRQEIVDAVMELEKQKQIVAKRQAATGALGWVCYAVVTLGLVGVIGWHVAGQVAPATYIASAEITADTRGNTPSADELAAWAESIKALAKDPQTLGAAAENYLRRGTPSLGNLAAVKQKMDRDLYLKAEQPGMIKVEMRSAGRERAMRELETFIASLAGEAERQRTLRADGCGTIVTQQPQAGSEPLESERMLWAASIGGGGFVACLMGAGFIYRMLLRSRYKFEQEQLALENG